MGKCAKLHMTLERGNKNTDHSTFPNQPQPLFSYNSAPHKVQATEITGSTKLENMDSKGLKRFEGVPETGSRVSKGVVKHSGALSRSASSRMAPKSGARNEWDARRQSTAPLAEFLSQTTPPLVHSKFY